MDSIVHPDCPLRVPEEYREYQQSFPQFMALEMFTIHKAELADQRDEATVESLTKALDGLRKLEKDFKESQNWDRSEMPGDYRFLLEFNPPLRALEQYVKQSLEHLEVSRVIHRRQIDDLRQLRLHDLREELEEIRVEQAKDKKSNDQNTGDIACLGQLFAEMQQILRTTQKQIRGLIKWKRRSLESSSDSSSDTSSDSSSESESEQEPNPEPESEPLEAALSPEREPSRSIPLVDLELE